MNCKRFILLVCLILIRPYSALTETVEFVDFKKNILKLNITDPEQYKAQLGNIIENARDQGAPFAQLIIVAIDAGVPLDLFITASMKFYPAEDIVLSAITSGGDPAKIIKTAILSGGDPAEIEAGAIQAGISPVAAATMVSAALNVLSAQEEKESNRKLKDEEGLGSSPGDGIGGEAGGLPGGGVGPVGGAGGGFASPS